MSDIVWEDPPNTPYGGNGGGRWQRFVAELKKHPGKWAIAVSGSEDGNSVIGGVRTNLRRYGCEVTSRIQPDRTHNLYARWPESSAS